jgi:hypothetical protein
MAHPPTLWFSSATLVAAAVLAACGGNEAKPGEVMLVISTDMAVPSDLDAIDWSVTLEGGSKPFQSGTLALTSNLDLPATLSIAAGSHTTAPVTVHVAGRKGEGSSAEVRVTRDERIIVRNDGVSRLDVPLQWLCSDANLATACPQGWTCEAGQCVAVPLSDAAELPAYSAANTPDCFDVTSCFAGFRVKPPQRDPTTGTCTVTGTSTLGASADVNLALAVDTTGVGAYGFCGIEGECLIPLHRGTGAAEWQTAISNQGPAVVLPDATCDDQTHSTKYVIAADLSASCPASSSSRPFCASAPSSCEEAPICPGSWPAAAWQGFACTGGEQPIASHPELLVCWTPDLTSDSVPASANGRWCCTQGEPPSNEPLVIDDMSGGPVLKNEPNEGEAPGWWYTSLASGSGDIWPPPPPALFTYREFTPPEQPVDGPPISRAACVKSQGFLGYVAMEGFFFSQLPHAYGASPYDVSSYSGISFWARSWDPLNAPLSVQVDVPNVDTYTEARSTCWGADGSNNRCDDFHETLTLHAEWQKLTVRWDELAQSREDWDPPQVRFDHFTPEAYTVNFMALGAAPGVMSQPFDFCVAHVSFTQD